MGAETIRGAICVMRLDAGEQGRWPKTVPKSWVVRAFVIETDEFHGEVSRCDQHGMGDGRQLVRDCHG